MNSTQAPRRVENVQTDRGSLPVYATGTVEQPWDSYSESDHDVWRQLYRRQHEILPGRAFQHRVELGEARDAVRAHAHHVLRLQEFVRGASHQQFALTLVQLPPHVVVGVAVVVPRLVDDAGGIDRHLALVGDDVLKACGLGVHGRSLRLHPRPA